jgi:hypothetical protein
MTLVPHGFYAPYARYEPAAAADTVHLAATLQSALRRSLDAQAGQEFVVGNWKLDLASLTVDHVASTDGAQLSFRVRFTANGVGAAEGAQQLGWEVVATVPANPTSATFSKTVTIYRFPEADFTKYVSPFKEFNQQMFNMIFRQGYQGFDYMAPALALNAQEDEQFRRFLAGVRGDPSAFSDQPGRMLYLSVVIITTLGLGDIVPLTWQARALVGLEAITGVFLAGLFLNALAYRASRSSRPAA